MVEDALAERRACAAEQNTNMTDGSLLHKTLKQHLAIDPRFPDFCILTLSNISKPTPLNTQACVPGSGLIG